MKHTEETKKKISESLKRLGIKPPGFFGKGKNNPFYGKHHTKETKEILSKKCGHTSWNKGKEYNAIKGNKNSNWSGGKPKCVDCGIKLSRYDAKRCTKHYREFNKGINHYKWNGGSDSELERKRTSIEYKNWRMYIFKRDWFICQTPNCGYKGKNIEAHHIKTVRDYPELIFDKDNGITLCKDCHLNIRNKEKELEKILEFKTP